MSTKRSTKPTFKSAVSSLKRLKVEFSQNYEYVGPVGPERHSEDRPSFDKFRLPFTSDEWMDLMNTEGEFLGICCGTISSSRDILLAQLRHGGWISCKDAWELAETLRSHDGFEWMTETGNLAPKHRPWKKENDPIYKFWRAWRIISPFADIGTVWTSPNPNPKFDDPVHGAVSVLHRGITSLWWSTGCFFEHENDPEWMTQQRIAQRKLAIARLLPALKTVLERVHTLDYADYSGFALCSKETPDHVLDNSLGLCIFNNKAEAKKMIEAWAVEDDHTQEPRDDHTDVRTRVVIRPVRVSTAEGLVFTDK